MATQNPPGSSDPRDLVANAGNLDRAVNADESTWVDRFGNDRPTLKRLESDYPLAGVYSEQAEQFRIAAEQSAADAAGKVTEAEAAKNLAVLEADRAETARDAAAVNANVYTDVATGRGAVTTGEQFQVLSADGLEVIRYRRDSASESPEVARFPSATVAGALPQNRRISRQLQTETFHASEIVGPLNHASGTIFSNPAWAINSLGHLVIESNQGTTLSRYWDVGKTWSGTDVLEVIVEGVWPAVADSRLGPYAHLGDVGGPSVRFLYGSNGALGVWDNDGNIVASMGGGQVFPELAFDAGETVKMRVVVYPDNTGFIEGIRQSGVARKFPIHSITPRGVVAPAVSRAGAATITKFRVKATDKRVESIPEIDARVAVLEGGASASSTARPLNQALSPAAINHLLLYGQSNSIGADATPPISLSQPFSNVTFNGGVAAWDGSAFDYAPLKPLVEAAGINGGPGGAGVPLGETPCSGAANYATLLRVLDGHSPDDHVILASTAGRGSYRIDQLEKGSSWYSATFIPMIQAAASLDPDYACHAVCWVQGERDADEGTGYAAYKTKLLNLQSDAQSDIAAISSQQGPTYLLVGQVTAYAVTHDGPARAMVDAAKESGKIFVVYPSYRIPYSNNIHYSNVGAKLVGAYFGRAYKQLLDGFEPARLKPLSAVIEGATIRVRFDAPQLPLVLDTDNLAATTDFGFSVTDAGGAVAIESVAIDADSAVLTLQSEPSGDIAVRYALDYAGSGRNVSGGAEGCGNLRDSTSDIATIGGADYLLFHAAPAFDLKAVRAEF